VCFSHKWKMAPGRNAFRYFYNGVELCYKSRLYSAKLRENPNETAQIFIKWSTISGRVLADIRGGRGQGVGG
jgi:hypothetical protein